MRTRIRKTMLAAALILALVPALPLFAQDRGEGKLDPAEPKGISVQEVIQRFAAKEKEFKQAREDYTWRQDIKVQTLDGDTVDGEYRMVFDVLFDTKGRRTEQVVFAPQSSLQRVSMSREDEYDLRYQLPFVLTSDDLPTYNVMYVGQQQQDEIHCFVFDIAPKNIEKDKRYFQGRIWVDDKDYQIVKTQGQTVPQIRKKNQENLFPKFTTYREQVDGRYWFPTYTRADDTLKFTNQDVRIREIIKYTNYKRFGSKVKITYEGQDVKTGGQTSQTPQGQQQPPQGQQPPPQPPKQ